MLPLAGVLFIYYLAHQVLQSTWVPYTTYRYGWSPAVTGASLAVVGVTSILVQGLLVPRFVPRFGERGAMLTGLFFGAVGYGAFGWATGTIPFMAAIWVFSLMGLIGPGVQGLMSRRVGPTEQGRLQGANMAVMAICSLFGPILFTEVFARAIGPWRSWAPVGAPFLLAAVLMVGGLMLGLAGRREARTAPAGAE
jgi:DHA1 family tetracycline resistance protein-like MFS transporter